ncbi:MAG: SBBP repeat-containing protein, partial [Acidobacteria bacterium]|nr:SBBP repeat-containing protein [Acidobacteriota bacterium]
MLVLTAPGRPAFENPVFEAGQPAPLMFIANQGQFDPAVKFELTGSMGSAVFTDNSIRIAVQKPGSIPPWAAEESPGGASPTPTPPAYSEEDPPRPEYSVVEIQFGGVNAAPQVGGEDSLATRISYFLGNDPAAWRMDVPAFSKIRYADFATGYDLEIDGSSGAWEWRLVESGDAAGAGGGGDPEGYASMQAEDGEELPDLTLTVEGGEVGVEGDNIVIETEAGEVTLPLIEVPQGSQPEDPSVEGDTVESPYSEGEGAEASAARKPVEKRAAGKGARDFFSWISASSYDSLMNPEALQPVENGSGEKGELLFSSYMGGAGDDVVSDAAYGPDGSMYVTGTAAQTWYISGATNVVSGSLGDYNVFVAKIDPQYHCEFIIFLGGEFSEAGSGIAVDESGSIYVVGHTYSPDFPMTSAHTPYKSALSCEYYCYADILLFKLAPAGNSLLYASYLGGSIFDYGYDIAYVPGSGGVVYIAGYTDSKHFYPFYQTGVGLSPDGVLAGFNTTLDGNASLITVQFIGGNGTHEQAHSVAVSPLDGSLWIVGQTAPLGGSGRFTALNGFDSEPGGGYDAFVVHFSTPSFSKMSSSYFGGSGDDCERGGSARECAIGVDAAGNAYITGNTRSPDLAQAYGEGLQAYGGGEDVFAAKIFTETCAGGGECMRLGYWRYLGGSGADSAFSIAVSAEGDAYISGETGSVNFGVDSFPKDLSMDPVLDFIDAFLIRLAPAGYVSYSTYYGGPDADFSKGVAVTEDGQKAAVVGGISDRKRDFPLVNPVDGDGGSGFEGIVGELSIPDWTPRIAIISPTDWAMVLSVVPTFTWKPAYEADRYILEIHRVNAQGEALEAAFKSKILLAADVCNNDGTCSFKLNNPEEVRDITKDILPSGSTLETGGYAWKITAEAANGKIIAESEYGYFQIPSLGGTWKDVKDAGLCDSLSCFMNGKPIVENPTWNEYDDWIYINAERWDIPPSLIKAIMAGETVHGIAPWIFGDESFPPNESYLYEPGEDCKFFVIDNDEFILEDTYKIKDFAIGIFENWDMGANPPWETTCQNGKPCTAPYNLDGNNLMMSIYDFAIGRGYGIGYKDPFDKYTDDIPGCNTRDHIAQYRISAGYGLGGITYIHEYRDILEHASKFYGSSVPQYIPPEFLYDPGFNIYMMGKILNDKRCACNDPVSAYTYEALEEWKNMVSAYNGWGNCPYGVKNLGRVKFTLPRSLKPEVNTVLREKTQHTDSAYKLNDETCDRYKACNSTRKSATSASTTMGGMSFARADNSDPQIVSSQMVDLKEDLGSVRVDLLIEKQDAYYIGWIRIYRDEDGTELIWQSDPIGNITLPAWIDTLEYEGGVIILTNWGDGAHATRVIPVIWDGISFRQVIARDENEQDVYIGGDGGAIIPYSQGYLA